MEIPMTRNILAAVVALCAALTGCSKLGPQKKNPDAEPPAAAQNRLYEVDLSKPEGPMMQILRAAQDRDEEEFKASFAPTINTSRFDENLFRKFRRKVLQGKVT